jgi:hypothetical protein
MGGAQALDCPKAPRLLIRFMPGAPSLLRVPSQLLHRSDRGAPQGRSIPSAKRSFIGCWPYTFG